VWKVLSGQETMLGDAASDSDIFLTTNLNNRCGMVPDISPVVPWFKGHGTWGQGAWYLISGLWCLGPGGMVPGARWHGNREIGGTLRSASQIDKTQSPRAGRSLKWCHLASLADCSVSGMCH
jgi:hypothetical protein